MIIAKAILEINPNAVFSYTDIDNITWLEGTTPISKADIEAKIAELPTEEQEKQAVIDKKASGKQKLKDLGLDDAEIKALIGA